jgi:predicted nucleic acid-binding protein
VLDRYVELASNVSMPDGFSRADPKLPTDFPRCRDRDDEIFLALAYRAQADALVTKDKVVLKLRRKARKFGVAIIAPGELKAVD